MKQLLLICALALPLSIFAQDNTNKSKTGLSKKKQITNYLKTKQKQNAVVAKPLKDDMVKQLKNYHNKENQPTSKIAKPIAKERLDQLKAYYKIK